MSKIFFRYGVMGAAKSQFLMTTVYNFRERGFNVLVIKPSLDTRSDKIQSRTGMELECMSVSPTDSIYSLISLRDKIDWIVCDESQFFTERQIDELAEICDDFGISVICYGLKTDFRNKLFEGSKRLLEVCDTIEEIKSSCACGRKATINARFRDGALVTDGESIMIGGNESYMPMCRRCWSQRVRMIRHQCDDACGGA